MHKTLHETKKNKPFQCFSIFIITFTIIIITIYYSVIIVETK